jgi:hypothetical protein
MKGIRAFLNPIYRSKEEWSSFPSILKEVIYISIGSTADNRKPQRLSIPERKGSPFRRFNDSDIS